MYNNPFFMPGYSQATMASSNLMRGLPAATRNAGLFSKLGSSLAGIRKINWGGLINNTSKTLGIINQTIPIVRQVGPMMNNMKSMIRVASIFKDETDTKRKPNNYTNTNYTKNISPLQRKNNTNKESEINTYKNKSEEYSESPTFFINT